MPKKPKARPKDKIPGPDDLPADEAGDALDEWPDSGGLTGEGVESVIAHLQDMDRDDFDPDEA